MHIDINGDIAAVLIVANLEFPTQIKSFNLDDGLVQKIEEKYGQKYPNLDKNAHRMLAIVDGAAMFLEELDRAANAAEIAKRAAQPEVVEAPEEKPVEKAAKKGKAKPEPEPEAPLPAVEIYDDET